MWLPEIQSVAALPYRIRQLSSKRQSSGFIQLSFVGPLSGLDPAPLQYYFLFHIPTVPHPNNGSSAKSPTTSGCTLIQYKLTRMPLFFRAAGSFEKSSD
jgi:hypothetical protein